MHRIKELREAKRLSIRALALATGFSHSTILRIEKGERKISTPQAVALADFFGVTLAVLRTEFPIAAVNAHDYSVFAIELV